jgi:DNA-binding PadR family transcriptional regulator
MKETSLGSLGEFEQLVLLALLHLGESGYAINARAEIERRTGRQVTRGAVYVTLDRLEKKGYLESWFADPTPERGGRAKRYFRVRPAGIAALRHSRTALQSMWRGLEPILAEP